MVPTPRLRAQIFLKSFLLGPDTLNFNSVKFFDWAITLKIDPFPYMGVKPYMEITGAASQYFVCEVLDKGPKHMPNLETIDPILRGHIKTW